jgi:hypothetical protein
LLNLKINGMNGLSKKNKPMGGQCPKCLHSFFDCTCKAEPKLNVENLEKRKEQTFEICYNSLKKQYDILKDVVDGNIIVNNTTLYESLENQELCLIADISKKCTLINKKSIIKILNL